MNNENKRPLIILTGPTAVGKTEYSIKLAQKINGQIISADSVQIYKYMDIGSAKVSLNQMQGVKHYLIDELYPDQEFNVAVFQKMARKYMEEIYSQGGIPIIAGGTGFYIQSVLYDINFEETNADENLRNELEIFARENGNEALHERLKVIDPEAAESIHFNNVKRVIRALEYNKQTGNKISEHNKEQSAKQSPYNFLYLVLNDDRQLLYDRIEKRVDMMMEQGLVEEVRHLLEMGYSENLTSMQGIGYKEIVNYLKRNISLDEAVEEIKLNTKHFAKRQLTWFRREKDTEMIYYPDYGHDKNRIEAEIIKRANDVIG